MLSGEILSFPGGNYVNSRNSIYNRRTRYPGRSHMTYAKKLCACESIHVKKIKDCNAMFHQ